MPTLIEDASMAVFLVGLGLGLVRLRKWGIAYEISAEAEGGEYERKSP